ncbi:MAG TPA: amidohydrolase family protein [Gemmatimonadaceae bacterium]|nr:amidohydrolase family protein [Gemmatimonadaceae bacterium]
MPRSSAPVLSYLIPLPRFLRAPVLAITAPSVIASGVVMVSSAVTACGALHAQERPAITAELRPFVSVDAPIVALRHVRLIDGTGAAARDDQTVIVSGSRIAAVGPTASTPLPAGAQVLDLAGHTVIPGLVGLHEHTYFGGVRRITQMSTSAPLLYLAFGVTTAMTAGSMLPYQELNMARMVNDGRLPGPHFLITGPYLDGGTSTSANAKALKTPEEATRSLAFWHAEGVRWVKVQGRISRAMLGHVIRQAHARGMKVTGHLCSVTFAEAAALGIDALQHGFITASDYVPGKKPDVCPAENMRVQSEVDVGSPAVQASITALATTRSAVVSTLAVYETFSPERFQLDTAAMAMLDPEVRREVEQNYANIRQGGLIVSRQLLSGMMRWERDFVAAGGLLGAGSDPWGTGFLPGFGNIRNYEMLREAGFSPEQSIQVLTYNGARILGMERSIGAVTIGRQADLVVVKGDPVANAKDLYHVTTVFRAGVGYDSDKLRAAARGLVGVR